MENYNLKKDHCIFHPGFINEYIKGYIDADGNGTYMPIYYKKYADVIRNFAVQDTDVFVISYPKTGTTWTQEMVWLIGNNYDFEQATITQKERFPFLEVSTLYDYKKFDRYFNTKSPEYRSNSIEFAKNLLTPRFIKTHVPFNLLPDEIKSGKKSPKIIYVMRNPKDTCISYHNHGNIILGWSVGLEDFCQEFLSENVMYGSFWKHVLGYWEQKNQNNLLIITYEDMKRDLPAVIKKVAAFMEKPLTNENLELLTKHLSFEHMKNNSAVNYEDVVGVKRMNNVLPQDAAFMKSGKVGNYKDAMSPELIEKFNIWTKQHVANTGFAEEFSYILY